MKWVLGNDEREPTARGVKEQKLQLLVTLPCRTANSPSLFLPLITTYIVESPKVDCMHLRSPSSSFMFCLRCLFFVASCGSLHPCTLATVPALHLIGQLVENRFRCSKRALHRISLTWCPITFIHLFFFFFLVLHFLSSLCFICAQNLEETKMCVSVFFSFGLCTVCPSPSSHSLSNLELWSFLDCKFLEKKENENLCACLIDFTNCVQ